MDLAHLLRYLRPYRFHLIGALASLGLVTLSQLAVPRYAGVMVDEIIRTRSLGIVDQAAVLLLALFAARSIFLYAQIYLTYFLGHRTIADLRADLFASVQRWSLDRFAFWQSGDAISRILQDTQLIQTHMLTGAVDLIATAMMLFGVVVMLFVLEWRLALLVGSVIPLAFAVVRLFGKEIQRVAVRAQTHVAGLASSIREAFAGALVIRAFTQEDRENARFVSENERATAANLRIAKLIATQVPVVSFLTTLGIVIVLWVGGRLVTGGAMTPGDLIAFLAYVAIAVEPAAGLTRHYAEVRQALGAFSRIRPILNERPVVVEAPDAVELPSERVQGRVEFRDVSFRYTVPPSARYTVPPSADYTVTPSADYTVTPSADYTVTPSATYMAQPVTGYAGEPAGDGPQPAGDGVPSPTPSGGLSAAGAGQWVLRRVRLEVQPGERVAVVGLSGAGKTTLVHLLPRFYDPSEGSILIDGIDIRQIRLQALRRLIGFVPQETVLFRGTVRENIAYARNDSTSGDVEAAARAANAHDFIMAFPHGYETEIGEDGGMLSGGQRQRLAIARALLLNPRILILDEATSALDSESEALIQDALERAVEGRTTITIAHRLSTVRKADRIVVLDEGRIVEEGSHDSLLRRDGLYARLARLQWPDLVDVGLGAGERR